MKYSIIILSSFLLILASCEKETIPPASFTNSGTANNPSSNDNNTSSKAILVDASKDGGVWWFPQSSLTGFSSVNPHQGKALADYLRSLGFEVDELPRGVIITDELLSKYSKVIRATAYFSYTSEEVAAYQTFLKRSSSLFLISDHLQNSPNDQLSISLDLAFEGSFYGPVTTFQQHPITNGVSSQGFNAGSVLKTWDQSKVTPLGLLNFQSGTEFITAVAMGIRNHPNSKIFFIGDLNGVEEVPQPFTQNVVEWLFK